MCCKKTNRLKMVLNLPSIIIIVVVCNIHYNNSCLFVLDSMPVIVGILMLGYQVHSLKKTSFLCGINNIFCV